MNRNAKIAIGVAAVAGLLFITKRANAATAAGAPQGSVVPTLTTGLTAPNVMGMSNSNTGMLPPAITPPPTGPASVLPDLGKLIGSIFAASPAPAPAPTYSDTSAKPMLPGPAPNVQTVAAVSSPSPAPAPVGGTIYVPPSNNAAAPASYTAPNGAYVTALTPTQGITVKNGFPYLEGLAFTDMPGG